MLRLTPGALTSNLLEQRPADLPADLFVHGGVAPTHIDLIIFASEGPRRQAFTSHELLEVVHQLRVPVWVRIRGLADGLGIQTLLEELGVPSSLAEPLLHPPQRPQVDCLDEVLMVVIHRLRLPRWPCARLRKQRPLPLRRRRTNTLLHRAAQARSRRPHVHIPTAANGCPVGAGRHARQVARDIQLPSLHCA